MWDGDVQAEWHQSGVSLELYVSPDRLVTWSFEDLKTGEEEEEQSGHQVWMLPASRFGDLIHRL